jgi:hypothetical protein
MQDVLSVALRALSFVFLLQATGVAFFVAIFGRRLGDSRGTIRRLSRWAALLALACVAGHYALEAARMAGELSGMWDASLQRIVLSSSNGAALILISNIPRSSKGCKGSRAATAPASICLTVSNPSAALS